LFRHTIPRTLGGMSTWDIVAGHARRQDGAVSREQLLAAGLYPRHITAACRYGRLQRAFRGSYHVGAAPPGRHGRIWAACLSGGPRVFVTHATALELHRVLPVADPQIHLACPTRRRSRGAIRMHEAPRVLSQHLWRTRGMAVASPALALLDLAVDRDHDALELVVAETVAKRRTSLDRLDRILVAYPRHPGGRRLAAVLAAERDDPGIGRTHGAMEAMFLPLLRALPDLPPYVRNDRLELPDGRVVVPDVWFPGPRVCVELDSRTWHEQRLAMADDRRRDQRAAAIGIVVFRITWHQLLEEWSAVSADLLAVLARGPADRRTSLP